MFVVNSDETIEELGSLKIIQKKKGYRFSADSVLLAGFALPLSQSDTVIDLGTGSGVVPLILAQKTPVRNIIGIEIQEGLADIAIRNIELNNLSARIKIVRGDFRELEQISCLEIKEGSFSVVMSNPPYTAAGSGRVSPFSEKAVAKTEIACTLSDVIISAKYLAAKNGRVILIYPVLRLQEMFSVINDNKLVISRLENVCPEQGCAVKRFLIEVVKRQ